MCEMANLLGSINRMKGTGSLLLYKPTQAHCGPRRAQAFLSRDVRTSACSGRGVGTMPPPSPFEKANTRSTRAPSAAWAPIWRQMSELETPLSRTAA